MGGKQPPLPVMALCTNCEFAEAELRCMQCAEANDDHLFCRACSSVHVKVKRYRGHTYERAARAVVQCSNCDVQVATHRCADCAVDEQHLCRHCAVFHTKVKCFKHHRVVEVSGAAGGRGVDISAAGPWAPLPPVVQQYVGDVLDGLGAAFARTSLSALLDFSGVQVPQAQVYVPLLLCTAVSFLLLRPVLGKHGSSFVTIVGSLIVLRVMQSPAPRHTRADKGQTFTVSAGGRRDPSSQAAAAAAAAAPVVAPSLSPAVRLTGSSKASRQQRNPPLVLRSPLHSNGTGSDLTNWLPTHNDGATTAPVSAPPAAAAKRPPPVMQVGAVVGWEDEDDDEFRDEFSYRRHSTAATLRSRGPAYRGRRSKKSTATNSEG